MKSKRPSCELCLRPLKTCLCDIVQKVTTQVEVVVWQHPSEVRHPKGSAQLLHLCLQNSRLHVGETFSSQEINICPQQCVLLYPDESNDVVNTKISDSGAVQQILVLDGTWRKTRKLFFCNPWLQSLRRLSIEQEKSRYRIRKAELANQLSTFEAVVLSLRAQEGEAAIKPLYSVFEQFVDRYEAFLPSARKG